MIPFLTTGFSREAVYVSRDARKQRLRLNQSSVIGSEAVRDELGAVWNECRVNDWDALGAAPVSVETLRNAYVFLEALPRWTPAPSIGAEPSGCLTFEWHRDGRHTLSVSIDEENYLDYAALFGPSTRYGSEAFFGEVPDSILDLIRKVHSL
jgi:hypothetical protein